MTQIGSAAGGLDDAVCVEQLLLDQDSDMFLHVVPKRSQTPVKGEGRTVGDWEAPMQILGWHWAEGHKERGTGAIANVSDMLVADLTVIKPVDAASPILARLCAAAEPLATFTIKCLKSGAQVNGSQLEYLQLRCEDAYIRTFQVFTSGRRGRPVEVLRVAMQRFRLTYAPQKETGARGAEVAFSLDVPARKAG